MKKRGNLIDVIGWDVWFQIVVWGMAVVRSSLLLSDLAREIRKTGGGRQRSEGIKLIRRIQKHYDEQLAANSVRVKSNQIGWEI